MKYVMKWKKDKRGSMLASAYPMVLVAAIVISLVLTTLPPLFRKNTVDRISNEVARYVEIHGDASVAQEEFERLCRAKRVVLDNPSIHVDAITIGSSSNIQLEDEFTVIVEYDNTYEIGTIAKITKRAASKATGRSEHYWK